MVKKIVSLWTSQFLEVSNQVLRNQSWYGYMEEVTCGALEVDILVLL